MKYLIVSLCLSLSFGTFAETTLHWGINVDPLHYFIPAAEKFKINVEKRTKGKVKVKLTFSQYKQEERDHVQDVVDGIYDMSQETVINLQKLDPSLSFWELPYLFLSNEHVFEFTRSKYAKKTFRYLKKKKITGVEYTYSGGFIYVFGGKIDSLNDLRGKNFGVEDSGDFFKKEMASAFDVKIVKYGNQKNYVYSEIISSASDELGGLAHKDTINLTEHRVFARVLFLSDRFLSKLSQKNKAIVLEEAKKAAVFEREMAVNTTGVFLNILKEKGFKINKWSMSQKMNDKKHFKPQYERYIKKHGSEVIEFINSINKKK